MTTRDRVRAHFRKADRPLADVVRAKYDAGTPALRWAALRAHFGAHRAAPVALSEGARRQVRRMLASMREFPFEQYWESHQERYGGETGHSHRVAGDPIFHTICDVALVDADRAHVITALEAVANGQRSDLAPRFADLPKAIAQVAEALAEGRTAVRGASGTVRIQGPLLPPTWDEEVA